VILTRPIVYPPALISRCVVASPARMRGASVSHLRALMNGRFGGTERTPGKELKCRALLCGEAIFSRMAGHLTQLDE
jgi:hypothetical protein